MIYMKRAAMAPKLTKRPATVTELAAPSKASVPPMTEPVPEGMAAPTVPLAMAAPPIAGEAGESEPMG
jgi:hypothetical protein